MLFINRLVTTLSWEKLLRAMLLVPLSFSFQGSSKDDTDVLFIFSQHHSCNIEKALQGAFLL